MLPLRPPTKPPYIFSLRPTRRRKRWKLRRVAAQGSSVIEWLRANPYLRSSKIQTYDLIRASSLRSGIPYVFADPPIKRPTYKFHFQKKRESMISYGRVLRRRWGRFRFECEKKAVGKFKLFTKSSVAGGCEELPPQTIKNPEKRLKMQGLVKAGEISKEPTYYPVDQRSRKVSWRSENYTANNPRDNTENKSWIFIESRRKRH